LATSGWNDPNVDKDANSTRINTLCDKAAALDNNSEIYALRNMSATQQMMVDPQTRWQTYGVQASKDIEEGLKLNPENPRLYYLRGESIFNTPVAFGGGKEKAKPIFEKALVLFKADKPKPLYPNWDRQGQRNNWLCANKTGGMNLFKDLDPILHSQLRLAIVSLLMRESEAEFTVLKERTQATSGNLSVQINKLRRPVILKLSRILKITIRIRFVKSLYPAQSL
jgi:hypothetical protein